MQLMNSALSSIKAGNAEIVPVAKLLPARKPLTKPFRNTLIRAWGLPLALERSSGFCSPVVIASKVKKTKKEVNCGPGYWQ
jgi:hypothetical protein